MNEDSNASYPSPAPPSEDSQEADSNQGFNPDKKNNTRKRTASGSCKFKIVFYYKEVISLLVSIVNYKPFWLAKKSCL